MRRDRPSVAPAAEVLGGEEAERPERPEPADSPPLAAREDGLGSVLHEEEAELLGRLAQAPHRRALAEEVHDDSRAHPCSVGTRTSVVVTREPEERSAE